MPSPATEHTNYRLPPNTRQPDAAQRLANDLANDTAMNVCADCARTPSRKQKRAVRKPEAARFENNEED